MNIHTQCVVFGKRAGRVLRALAPAVFLLWAAEAALVAQTATARVPTGTPLPVVLGEHVPMRKGALLRCRLLYPVYADNRVVVPKGSVLDGTVVALKPDKGRRIRARLWGDFTPFHTPVARFSQIQLPDGTTMRIASGDATDGAPVLHLSTPEKETAHSLIRGQIAQARERVKDTVALVTAPGRGDRAKQLLYRQLPYHPERIEAGTMWTVTLTEPLDLKVQAKEAVGGLAAKAETKQPHAVELVKRPEEETAEVPKNKQSAAATDMQAATAGALTNPKPLKLNAYLEETLSSAKVKVGDKFEAVIAEPVFNPDHSVAVPEGAVLVGTITQAKPARLFGRSGKLRFDFRELKLPGSGCAQRVLGTLAGADSNASQDLKIDVEGGVQSKPKNRVIVPLILTFLAGRALDDDGNRAGNAAVASNGFGLVGRVVGIAGGSRNLAAGIGFYAAGLSFAERWLARGKNVVFPKNTRIEVITAPRGNALAVPEVK